MWLAGFFSLPTAVADALGVASNSTTRCSEERQNTKPSGLAEPQKNSVGLGRIRIRGTAPVAEPLRSQPPAFFAFSSNRAEVSCISTNAFWDAGICTL